MYIGLFGYFFKNNKKIIENGFINFKLLGLKRFILYPYLS